MIRHPWLCAPFALVLVVLAVGLAPGALRAQQAAGNGVRFALGDQHSCALLQGRGYCWGTDGQGELGRGSTERQRSVPTAQPVSGGQSFVSIAAGGHHTCAVQTGGAVYCWGQGNRGQLGDSTARSSSAPVRVSSGERFVSVAAGSMHTCGLTRAGAVYCWGSASNGRLGIGRAAGRCGRDPCAASPARVPVPEPVAVLAAGEDFTCALGLSGAALCWGKGGEAQLGNGARGDQDVPTPVLSATQFVYVTAGKEHACALAPDRTAWCWGNNGRGQVGDGVDSVSRIQPTPRAVAGSLRFTQIAARDDHTCGLTPSGRLYCWGSEGDEIFGPQPTRSRQREPLAVSDALFSSVAVGASHICGVGTKAELYCWGKNDRGQLGHDPRRGAGPQASPVAIQPLPEVAAVALDPTLRNGAIAPNGLFAFENNLRSLLASPVAEAAELHLALRRPGAPDDALLASLYRATTSHYRGSYAESGDALQQAADLAEDRYTKSVTRAALAMVTNDGALAFTPSRTEWRMIPYYAALNRLRQNDLPGAVVEARRLAALLEREAAERAPQGASSASDRRTRAFLRYFTGVIFEAAKERNDADVAFRNAVALAGDSVFPRPRAVAGARTGEVVVLVEWGFAPHRVEQELLVPLVADEMALLARDTTAHKAEIVRLVSGRILSALSSQPNDGVLHSGTRPSRLTAASPGGTALHVMKIAWPTLYTEQPAPPRLALLSAGRETPVRLLASLSDGVVADFTRDRPLILARTVLRSALKLAGAQAAGNRATKQGGVILGGLVEIVANSAANATERADTRSWYLLPNSVGLVRLRLPTGTQTLRLRLGEGAGARTVEVGTVDVRADGVTFVSTRVLDPSGTRIGPSGPASRDARAGPPVSGPEFADRPDFGRPTEHWALDAVAGRALPTRVEAPGSPCEHHTLSGNLQMYANGHFTAFLVNQRLCPGRDPVEYGASVGGTYVASGSTVQLLDSRDRKSTGTIAGGRMTVVSDSGNPVVWVKK